LTTAEVPICPPAPGRLSTITGCFQCSLMRCATMRAAMSAPAPVVSGTISRIVLTGYSCACAPAMHSAAAATTRTRFI